MMSAQLTLKLTDIQASAVVFNFYRTSSYVSGATLTDISYGSSSYSIGTLVHLGSKEREYEKGVCVCVRMHVCL